MSRLNKILTLFELQFIRKSMLFSQSDAIHVEARQTLFHFATENNLINLKI
jgi:hypothetical protein